MPQTLDLTNGLAVPATEPSTFPKSPLLPMNTPEADPWIFRDGRTNISGAALSRGIRLSLSSSDDDSIADALIQAGELEAGISDAGLPATEAAQLTDVLATALCVGEPRYVEEAQQLLEQLRVPEQVSVSPPEGFTYYALHPLDFHRVSVELTSQSRSFAIVGIRSIGTTLSAVVAAFLKQQHRPASRITVRPEGHPYSRKMEFHQQEEHWLRERNAEDAHFVIVDEGPGRSGSTFLSVAEALLRLGIPRERITLLGSRWPDPSSLLASQAAHRWSQFRFLAAFSSVTPRFERDQYAGGGYWRNLFLGPDQAWPESWSQMERLKFVSADRRTLFKFEGIGRIGAQVRERAFMLAEAGFTPAVSSAGAGFLAYELLPGPILNAKNLSSNLLDFMAEYCTFRTRNFSADIRDESQLRQMLEFNVPNEFGCEVILPNEIFSTPNPVFVDGRMQPYEWVSNGRDKFLKTDAISHGDDHFFPGPCDIVWDFAGIAVEWQLGRQELATLIEKFERLSGMTNIQQRLSAYMLAYSVFRLGFSRMACESISDYSEQVRFRSAYVRYRGIAEELLRRDFRTRSIQSTS